MRESFFPAIKCSMCNADVEISQMGDHICAGESEGTLKTLATELHFYRALVYILRYI